jgi:hypothetical protein
MSVEGVTHATRLAVSAAISANGLECLPYDEWDVPMGSMATLGALPTWELAEGYDQGMRIKAITFDVLVYQLVDNSIRESVAYGEQVFERALDAVGADPTCSHNVVNMTIAGVARSIYYRETGGQMVVVVEMPLRVEPHANAATV